MSTTGPTIGELLRRNSEEHGEKVAFSSPGRVVTHKALLNRTGRIACGLKTAGVERGHYVVIFLDRCVEAVESILAAVRAGAIAVPLDPRCSQAELAVILGDICVESRWVITSAPGAQRLRGVEDGLKMRIWAIDQAPATLNTAPYQELEANEGSNPPDDLASTDKAFVFYTSGSTGSKPKGVVSSQCAWLQSTLSSLSAGPDVFPEDTILCPLPITHAFGFSSGICVVLCTGASMHMTGQQSLNDALSQHSYTIIISVPTIYNELVGLDLPKSTLSSIRLCVSGGAAASLALNQQVEAKLGVPILNHYGCTETCGIVTVCQLREPYVDGSCGRLVPGRELRMVDPTTGQDTPDGDEGEIWISSPSLLIEYHNDPTPPSIDGWYRSGDMGYLDNQGNLFITGRLKETIVRGGENIHPAEIERVLNDCKGVKECVVLAAPHDIFGEVPVAYLVLEKTTFVSMTDLIAACRKALPNHKIPVDFFEIDAIPQTRSGKPRRRATASCPKRRLVASMHTTETIKNMIIAEFRHARGLSETTYIDPTTQFGDLGMNSLVGIVIRDRLMSMTGLTLPITLLFDHSTPRKLAERVYGLLSGEQSTPLSTPLSAPPSSAQLFCADDPIAIISIACRYPGGIASPEDLWRVVEEGIDVTSDFPTDRGWDLETFYNPDPEVPGSTTTRRGGFLHDVAEFDAGLFGMSPREALTTDPQQRLLLETTWTLLERAGLPPLSLRGSDTGVYVGVMYNDYASRFTNVKHEHEGQLGLGSAPSMAAGRVSHFFDFHGPSLAVDTACSSSLVAIDQAVKSLRTGECSLAIAGGVTVMATAQSFVMFSKQRGLSPDGRCRSYSGDANGTAWSEGVGLLLLERLSDARRNGHQIHGLIRGVATNSDGRSSTLTSPSGPQQERVIQAALRNSGLSPADIDVIEGHGTATPLGDPIEVRALIGTYDQNREQPTLLGSLKSNLGHTQAAAGVAGIIKMVMAMQKGVVPATLHVRKPSRHIDWENANIELVTKARNWPESGRPRRAAVSAFGIGGTNAHLVLEQGKVAEDDIADVPGHTRTNVAKLCPWLLSGADHSALQAQAQLALGLGHPDPSDVAFSFATTRSLLRWRAAVPPGDTEALKALAKGAPHPRLLVAQAIAPRLVVMFSGQGGQFAEMFDELSTTFHVFKYHLKAICDAIDNHIEQPLMQTLQSSAEIVHRTDISQPALFAFQVALYRTLEHFGIVPTYLIGHSIGEITAAHVRGILTLEDAAKLAVTRGRLMSAVGKGAMASIEASEEEVQQSLDGLKTMTDDIAVIAAINSEDSMVISGPPKSVQLVEDHFRAQGRRTKRLQISHACHSPAMKAIGPEFQDFLETITYHELRIPIISTVTGSLAKSLDLCSPEYWTRQLVSPVRFADAVRTARELGCSHFLEIGPSAALASHVQDAVPTGATIRSFIEALTSLTIQGCDVAWSRALEGSGAKKVDLPTYPFQRKRYWLDPPNISETDGETGGGFLDAGVSVPGSSQVVFSGIVPLGKFPWLGDHVMGGKTILPATAFVEMALKAGREVGLNVLGELTLLKPLDSSEGDDVRLQMIVEDAGTNSGRTFNIFSRPTRAKISEDWNLHASGVLQERLHHSVQQAVHTSWPTQGEIEITGAYNQLQAAGISYGPAFRCIQRLCQTQEGFVAKLVLPEECRPGDHLVHPALLDAALHVPLLASPSDAITRLPFRLAGVRLWPSKEREVRAVVRNLENGDLAVTVYDLRGHLVAEIDTVCLRKMAKKSGDLFALQWSPIPMKPLVASGRKSNEKIVRIRPKGQSVEAVHEAVNDILGVVQAWNRASNDGSNQRLVIITERATTSGPDLSSAAVWGFIRSAQSESGDQIVLIDVDGTQDSEEALHEAIATDETVLAIRNGKVLIPKLVRGIEMTGCEPLSSEGTVLITGGTGAVGSVLCRHLVQRHGVTNLLLTSRTGDLPDSLTDLATTAGVRITTRSCDVADYAQLKALVDITHPPVTAVFHLAGILDDAMTSSLTPDRMERVLCTKANGAWNLHNLLPNARPFVLFSSAAGILGNPGQANYAAANTYLDALARYRSQHGLHAVSLAWGPWENAGGMAGDIKEFGQLQAMSDEVGMELLDQALRSVEPVVVPLVVKGEVPDISRRTLSISSSHKAVERGLQLNGLSPEQRLTELRDLLSREIAHVLGYDKLPDLPFTEIGVDSLTGVLIRNKINKLTGVALSSSVMFEVENIEELSNIVLEKLDEDQASGGATPASSEYYAEAIEREDEELDTTSKMKLTMLFRQLCLACHYTEALGMLTIASLTLPTFTTTEASSHTLCLRRLQTSKTARATIVCLPDFLPPTRNTSVCAAIPPFLDNDLDVYDIVYPTSTLPDNLSTLTALLAQTIQSSLRGDQQIILIGYSAGGLVAHSLAHTLETKLAGLVLIDTYPIMEPIPNWLAALPANQIFKAGNLFHDRDLATMGHYTKISQGCVLEKVQMETLFIRASEPMPEMMGELWQACWRGADETVMVPGNHIELLRNCAESTAREINRWTCDSLSRT
ncbi:hypothetical protein PRZ48_013665 [Zasmidium cellare]|uniref:Polyketide synthase n=1 Tax=Zasmidium cellare TaxID=395010 RepID=A0ABR0E1P0_ZASCE|nr:hypothetical protein PRZ48_013665 [Zasmidium cellare]